MLVTGEAVRQARQTIRKLRRQHPHRRIIVTWCAAQLAPRSFADMPEVDRVLGNAELHGGQLAGDGDPDRRLRHHAGASDGGSSAGRLRGRARAFVEVQQGCDHRCTFCVIPFARGPNRSVLEALVTAAVRQLVENGYREVVLTGVDICSWGADLPAGRRWRTRCKRSSPRSRAARLRLPRLDPAAIDERLFRALAEEPRLMPHLHLSLQAMDDLILKRMKRRHSRAEAFAIAARARMARPDVVFGADLIAGFPTESEAMFLEHAERRRGDGPHLPTRVSVFASPEHAGGADAASARPRAANGPPAARGGCSGAPPACRPRRHTDGGAGGRQRCRPVPVVRAGRSRRVRRWRGEPGTLVPVRIHAADKERLYAEMAS